MNRHYSNSYAGGDQFSQGSYLAIICNLCGTPIAGKTQYGKHMAEYHPTEIVDHPYKCSECPKGFFSSQGLKHHMEVHSERPSCHLCSLTFRYSRNLKRHLEMSHGCKECRYCKKIITMGREFALHYAECCKNQPYSFDNSHLN